MTIGSGMVRAESTRLISNSSSNILYINVDDNPMADAGSSEVVREPQNLIFDGSTVSGDNPVIWNTKRTDRIFVNEDKAAVFFFAGDNVRFESDADFLLGEDIDVGKLSITGGADVAIDHGSYTLNYSELALLGGSLKMGDSLNLAAGQTLAVGSNGSVLKSDLSLESDSALRVDFSGGGSATGLNNGSLSLQGGTCLQLMNCGAGDGKTYTLFTGVSDLRDATGNAIVLNSSNNAASHYFDTSQPGTGFWADATLQLTSDGALQLVRYADIALPAGYTEVLTDDVSDVTAYAKSACDVIFRLTTDMAVDGRTTELMTSSADSWCFTSDSEDQRHSLTFSNTTTTLFDVCSSEKLEFVGLKNLIFKEITGSIESGSYNNYATAYGAIGKNFAETIISLINNGNVTFSGNTARAVATGSALAFGSSIKASYGTLTLNNNGSVTFNGNMAYASAAEAEACGGAIYMCYNDDTITLSGNGSVEFSGNSTYATASGDNARSVAGGGAIDVGGGALTLSNNGSVTFFRNSAYAEATGEDALVSAGGGAINGNTAMSGNGIVAFSENTASTNGGAINGNTTMSGNGIVTFSGNTAMEGGAIDGNTTMSANGSVMFSENSASTNGGAIYGGRGSTITLNDNGSVIFRGNKTSAPDMGSNSSNGAEGGAIFGYYDSTIILRENEGVTFRGNTASATSTGDNSRSYAEGGAISGYQGALKLSDNSSVEFIGNSASTTGVSSIAISASGGAIYRNNFGNSGTSTTSLSNNGCVTFSGNTVSSTGNVNEAYAYGGAIYGDGSHTITLSENGSVTFISNTASVTGTATRTRVCGGAIYAGAGGSIHIRNNGSVLFEKNAEVLNNTYQLRSIYVDNNSSYEIFEVSISVAEGKSIEFRDSVYISSGSTVELNADYTDASGVVHKQTGDIIFTGKYTEQHLNELLSAAGEERTATESEILSSRTFEVYSKINLYGGCLRVEDGAVLDCAGLIAAEGSAATLRMKDAEVKGGTLTFNSGTALELEGVNKIQSLVNLNASSDLRFVAGGESRVSGTGSLVLGGGLSVADGADVILEVAASAAGVTVGDDASLSLRGNFSLAPGAEDSVGSKLITVGRNAELSLTDSSLLGQVALADETSGLYYQYTNGAKLLQFSGDLGTGGLNLTTEADGYTVTVSGGTNFAGDITVLDGAVFNFRGNNTTLDATAKISLDSGSTLKLSGSDYAVMSDVLKRATGAGNARLESEAYLSHEDKIQLTGDLIVGSGGRLYLGELPNKVHGGDLYTDSGTAPVAPCTGTLVLDGGSLTFRGSRMELGRMDVTANSSLEIWDQAGNNQKANEYCSIAELNVNASLQLATTWKSKLDIDVLQGSGAVTVGSSKEYREVRVHDLSGYTGVLSATGSKTTLGLNLVSHSELNADSVQLSNGATATLSGSGTYHLATAKTLADGVSLAEDWSGVVRLSGATLVDDTLSGLSNANSSVELNGVSGYLSRADAQTGAQTYDVNLKLTDNENAAAWNLNNGYNGDKRIFTGEITGTGTLERSSYRGTHQTLVFTGDTSGWTGAINHLPDSATSNGAPISTNVTFSGSQVLNVSTSTNGKGELNVTLDDEHLQAGSKVSVNGAIGANRLTVTEGTTVSLNNEVNVNTLRTAGTAELSADASVRLGGITLSADNPVSALISGVESTGSTMRGLRADAVVKNVSIISTVSAYTVSSMTLQGVQFATETEQTALTLSGVVFDGTCSFSVGETGQILLDKAILTVLVGTPAGGGNGVLALDYSDLFHCTASGELEITMDKDVEQLLAAGYHTITLDLGDDVNYDNLNLTLNGATYAGNSQGVAQFSLRAVPEPTSATLSLLALAALAARRRRK